MVTFIKLPDDTDSESEGQEAAIMSRVTMLDTDDPPSASNARGKAASEEGTTIEKDCLLSSDDDHTNISPLDSINGDVEDSGSDPELLSMHCSPPRDDGRLRGASEERFMNDLHHRRLSTTYVTKTPNQFERRANSAFETRHSKSSKQLSDLQNISCPVILPLSENCGKDDDYIRLQVKLLMEFNAKSASARHSQETRRYLIDSAEWSKLKKFRDGGPRPGPIDNSRIATGDPLKLRRFHNTEYYWQPLLPDTWRGLRSLFGDNSHPEWTIESHRSNCVPELYKDVAFTTLLVAKRMRLKLPNDVLELVLKLALPASTGAELMVSLLPNGKIEAEPLTLKLQGEHEVRHSKYEINISRMSTVGNLREQVGRILSSTKEVELRIITPRHEKVLLETDSKTLFENEVINEQTIYFSVTSTRRHLESPATSRPVSPPMSPLSYNFNTPSPESPASSYYGWNTSTDLGDLRSETAGLTNIGNTCFMNASLQCLANIPEFQRYFIKKLYEEEINRTNPIGHEGQLAEAYADTINTMWHLQGTSFAPYKLKAVVGRCNSRFQGYEQHDSQEFVSFLLDGLHEDLNRIISKPLVPAVETKNMSDKEAAKQTWDAWKLRNDSVIVDLFSGQFKSTVRCPSCEEASVTFDPYMILSIPVSENNICSFRINIVWASGKSPTQYKLKLSKGSCSVDRILENLSNLSGVNQEQLVCAKIGHQFKVVELESSDTITIDKNDNNHVRPQYIVYEVDPHETPIGVANPIEYAWVCFCYDSVRSQRQKLIDFPFRINCMRDSSVAKQKLWQMLTFARLSTPGSPKENSHYMNEHNNSNVFPKTIELATIGEDGLRTDSESQYLSMDFESYSDYDDVLKKQSYYDAADGNESDAEPALSVSLKSCLDNFQQEQTLDEDNLWYCPTCKQQKRASKRLEIWSVPQILVVHLKRFSYTRFSRDKITSLVEFPTDDLDLSEHILYRDPAILPLYELVGVSHHVGGLAGGHYTASVLSAESKEWVYCNDSYVASSTASDARATSSYLLFYRRKV